MVRTQPTAAVWSTGFSLHHPFVDNDDDDDSLFPSEVHSGRRLSMSRCPPPLPPTPCTPVDFVNLSLVEELLGDAARATDHYYDEIRSPCYLSLDSPRSGCFGRGLAMGSLFPAPETFRRGCHLLLAELDDDLVKHRVAGVASDLFVEVIQLGSAALRLGAYAEEDLNHCVDAARHATPKILALTGLADDGDVVAVLRLLQSPARLHTLLVNKEHGHLLSLVVMCFRNLMLSLVHEARSPSPADLAAKSEVFHESSLAVVGARDVDALPKPNVQDDVADSSTFFAVYNGVTK